MKETDKRNRFYVPKLPYKCTFIFARILFVRNLYGNYWFSYCLLKIKYEAFEEAKNTKYCFVMKYFGSRFGKYFPKYRRATHENRCFSSFWKKKPWEIFPVSCDPRNFRVLGFISQEIFSKFLKISSCDPRLSLYFL